MQLLRDANGGKLHLSRAFTRVAGCRRAGYDRGSRLRRSLSSGFTVVFSSSCRLVVWPDARRRTPDENSLCVLCALCVRFILCALCVLCVRFRRGWRVRGGTVEAHRDFAADVLSVGDADSFEGKPQKPGLAADGKDPDFVRWNEGRGDFAGLKSVPPFRKKPVVERGGGLVNADAPLGDAVECGFIGTVGNPPAGCDFRGTEAVERHTTRKGRRRVRGGVRSGR